MDIQAEKLDLIARLIDVHDEYTLLKVKDILKKNLDKRKNTMEPEEESLFINVLQESDEDYSAGRVHCQNEIKAYFENKKNLVKSDLAQTDKQKFTEIGEKIELGMTLAFERLLEKKAKEDGYLVFSENGKIVHVRARELYEKAEERKGFKE